MLENNITFIRIITSLREPTSIENMELYQKHPKITPASFSMK
jgi:hypothetical protein